MSRARAQTGTGARRGLRESEEASLVGRRRASEHWALLAVYRTCRNECVIGAHIYAPTAVLGDSCDDCIEITICLVRVVSNSETRRANNIGQVVMMERSKVDYVPTMASSALSVFEEEHDLRGAR